MDFLKESLGILNDEKQPDYDIHESMRKIYHKMDEGKTPKTTGELFNYMKKRGQDNGTIQNIIDDSIDARPKLRKEVIDAVMKDFAELEPHLSV